VEEGGSGGECESVCWRVGLVARADWTEVELWYTACVGRVGEGRRWWWEVRGSPTKCPSSRLLHSRSRRPSFATQSRMSSTKNLQA
jgi:hypothetical protein